MAAEKRRDNKGRLLHTGELQMKDGRYRYKYKDSDGKTVCVYSDRLDVHDPIPVGKKKKTSLRELEKDIKQKLAFHLVTNAGKLTVNELVDRYIGTRENSVRPTTRAGYKTVQNLMKKESFGKKRIDSVKILDAKEFLIKLQKEDKKSFSSIQTVRGVLRPAFQLGIL